MTPQQALQMVAEALTSEVGYSASFPQHLRIQQALKVLNESISKSQGECYDEQGEK